MKKIIAAGGLVRNPKNEYLFIFRKGKWDLPKGKVDKGEKIEDAAVREVQEECGISDLKIIKPLLKTYHSYVLKGKNVWKETHWFLMLTEKDEKPTPQLEEDITEAVWADEKKVLLFLENTYDTIREVVRAVQ